MFTYPGFLYFLVFLSVPIILSIIKFKKKETFYFSSLEILKKIYNKRKKILRFQNLLMLLLRLLMILLLVLLFADLIFKKVVRTDFVNLFFSQDAVVLVDNSLSMSYQKIEGNLFENTKDVLNDLITNNNFPAGISINQLYQPSPFIRTSNKTELYDKIDNLFLTEEVQTLSSALNNIDNEIINKDVILFTDMFSAFNDYENIDFSRYKSFNIIRLNESDGNNIAINNVTNKNYFNTLNVPYNMSVQVQNYSNESFNSLPVYMYNYNLITQNFEINQIKYVDLAAHSKIETSFIVEGGASEKIFKFTIGNDRLPFDNEYFYVLQTPYNYRVSVYNNKALNNIQTLLGASSFFWHESTGQYDMDMIIMSVDDFNSEIFESVKEDLNDGMRLLLYTNNDMDITRWNNIYRDKIFSGERIIPGIIRQRVSDQNVRNISTSHPISFLYGTDISFDLNLHESFKISPVQDALSIVNYNDNTSLLSEVNYGNGKIILLGLDLSDNTIYDNISVLPFIMQVIEYYGTENYYGNFNFTHFDEVVYEGYFNSGIFKTNSTFFHRNLSRRQSNLKFSSNIPSAVNMYEIDLDTEEEIRIDFLQYKDFTILLLIIILFVFERFLQKMTLATV